MQIKKVSLQSRSRIFSMQIPDKFRINIFYEDFKLSIRKILFRVFLKF